MNSTKHTVHVQVVSLTTRYVQYVYHWKHCMYTVFITERAVYVLCISLKGRYVYCVYHSLTARYVYCVIEPLYTYSVYHWTQPYTYSVYHWTHCIPTVYITECTLCILCISLSEIFLYCVRHRTRCTYTTYIIERKMCLLYILMYRGGSVTWSIYVDSGWYLDLFALWLEPQQVTITMNSSALAAPQISFWLLFYGSFCSVCSTGCHSTAVRTHSSDLSYPTH
jgi:hypothetical protein